MKLFSEKVEYTSTNSTFNTLQVENFEEIFFGVYEIEINKNKYPVESIGTHKGAPVVSVPVVVGESKGYYPFILVKGKQEILFNEKSEPNLVLENIEPEEEEDLLLHSSFILDEEDDFPLIENNSQKEELLQQIADAKKEAKQQIRLYKEQQLKELTEEQKKKDIALREAIESTRSSLHEEFVRVSQDIKEEFLEASQTLNTKIIDENKINFSYINESLDSRIDQLSHELKTSIHDNYGEVIRDFDSKIRTLVKESYETLILPHLERGIDSHTKQFKKDFFDRLKKKAESGDVLKIKEDVDSKINSLTIANVEINDKLNRGINKALSRIGNVSNKLDENTKTLFETIDSKVEQATSAINTYYDNQLATLEERAFNLTEESRKYIVGLIQESKSDLISKIKDIKKEETVQYVIESKNKREVKDFDSIVKTLEGKITDKVSDEITRLRKYIAYSGGGGGSVAVQYANGGVMNGNLTVVGKISASEYLGAAISSSGNYLPLSGGSVNGNVTVIGTLSTTMLEALSANITVLDIKQYELSGFNVEGNITINGNISANGNLNVSSLAVSGLSRFAQPLTIPSPVANTDAANKLYVDSTVATASATPISTTTLTTLSGILKGNGTVISVASGGIDYANAVHTHTLSQITDAGTAAARAANQDLRTTDNVAFSSVSVLSGVQASQALKIGTVGIYSPGTNALAIAANTGTYDVYRFDASQLSLRGARSIRMADASSGNSTEINGEGLNILAVRSGSNGNAVHEFRVYGAYSSSGANYERFFARTNVGATSATQIGLSAAGTGQNRDIQIVAGGSTRMIITSAGDVELPTARAGIILRSPNNTRYRLTVTDAGALSTVAI